PAVAQVPHGNPVVGGAAEEGLAVRGEGQGDDEVAPKAPVHREPADRSLPRPIPQADLLPRPGGQHFAVRRKGDRAYHVSVPLEAPPPLPRGRVAEMDGVLVSP